MHYSGVVCRRTVKFENSMALALCSSRSPPALQEACPSQAQHATHNCNAWEYHRRCGERLKDRKHASGRTPIYHRLQKSRETSCRLELVCVEEGKLPEAKHRPAATPAAPKPITPSITGPIAGKTSVAPATIRIKPSIARHKAILEQQFRIFIFQILTNHIACVCGECVCGECMWRVYVAGVENVAGVESVAGVVFSHDRIYVTQTVWVSPSLNVACDVGPPIAEIETKTETRM